ncbi:thioredoxin family protein [Bizionia sp. KMM 8389]
MEAISNTQISDIIKTSLETSMSYPEYRELVKDLVATESATGADQSAAMVNYTMLNDRRMKRWDKTIKVSDEALQRLANFKDQVTWVVLTESWCGDAAHVIPAMAKLAALNTNITLKLVLRDSNDALMSQFLTNGGKSIPKLVMVDSEIQEVLNTYGPRPVTATKMVADYKAAHGTLTPEFKEDLQGWYNKDKGQSAINDLLNLLGV